MPPAATSTRANSAGARQSRVRVARIVRPTSHGRAAHGSSSTEIRAVNASWKGVSPYTSAPASAPARPVPSRVKSQRAPRRAAADRVPSQRRWATQSGTPRRSKAQNHGPTGKT